jgi:membrane protein implicated in regulation of membrane protease activity
MDYYIIYLINYTGGGNMPYTDLLWVLAIVVFLVMESLTYQMVSIWFIFGAIAGIIAYFLGGGFFVQFSVFIAVSLLLLILFRPVAMKMLKKQDFKSNADGLIGKDVLITEDIDNINGRGKGKINGMEWTVRTETKEEIKAGSIVQVKRIEGVKLIVE